LFHGVLGCPESGTVCPESGTETKKGSHPGLDGRPCLVSKIPSASPRNLILNFDLRRRGRAGKTFRASC
jgi:hypothetical protein